MTSEEIKKAFNICCSSTQGCTDCPILKLEKQNGRLCKYNLFTSVISLITKQEEEIKSLKTQLKQERDKTTEEFAEKLKETAFKMFSNNNEKVIYAKNADVLLNELLKEYEK